jgi:hypothetical protein
VQVISKASIMVLDSWWTASISQSVRESQHRFDKTRGCHGTCSQSPSIPWAASRDLRPSLGQESVLFKIILGLCRLRQFSRLERLIDDLDAETLF